MIHNKSGAKFKRLTHNVAINNAIIPTNPQPPSPKRARLKFNNSKMNFPVCRNRNRMRWLSLRLSETHYMIIIVTQLVGWSVCLKFGKPFMQMVRERSTTQLHIFMADGQKHTCNANDIFFPLVFPCRLARLTPAYAGRIIT